MQEKPKVVVSRTRRAEAVAKDFAFTESDVRAAGDAVASYRNLAWNSFKRLPLPVTTEEAWRRTDIHQLPTDKFKLTLDNTNDLPAVREDLLKPLVADQHGGQILITPGNVKIDLDEKLAKKGVIFTDLKTAEEKHPELLAKMLGKTVNVEEGKFSALAGALAQNGVVLYVPKGLMVNEPLHSVLWGPGANLAHVSHILVLVDEGALLLQVVHRGRALVDLAELVGLSVLKTPEGADRTVHDIAGELGLTADPGHVVGPVERTIVNFPLFEVGPIKPRLDVLPFIGAQRIRRAAFVVEHGRA